MFFKPTTKKNSEIASACLMVRPIDFCYNVETAEDNEFMHKNNLTNEEVNKLALKEFDGMVQTLKDNGVEVVVFDKSGIPELKDVITPDAVFPNNWILTEPTDLIYTFRMYAKNRRIEKKALPFIEKLLLENDFKIKGIVNIGSDQNEASEEFLESTGSMIIDRNFNCLYACRSHRTTDTALASFMELSGYDCIAFDAESETKRPIYHTNMMMSVGQGYVIVCLEAIKWEQRGLIITRIRSTGKEVIDITRDQALQNGCGNTLELSTEGRGPNVIVMSARAFKAFTDEQKKKLEQYAKIVPVNIDTIESVGGGSVRCMMCEIFLEKKKYNKDQY